MSNELAEKFLKSAEELLETQEGQERLLEALDQAEKILPEDVSVLCRSARLLFRYGVLNSKGRFYLLALDKLKLAEEMNPQFFEQTTLWLQLWGNILIQLGKLLKDSSFFEAALQKYERAEEVAKEINPDLYWDSGEAWILLGQQSGEPTDFQQGLANFQLASTLGIRSLFFRLDYAQALYLYGKLNGNPAFLEEAIIIYRQVISDAYSPAQELSVAYVLGWRKLALTMKLRFELSHAKEHFEEADIVFRDAILAASKNGELWLDWSQLFLEAGWLKRDFKLIEGGIEKLTSTKVSECDPIRVSYLLGMGLLYFGLYLENLKLLKDGQERIRSALELSGQNASLQYAAAFANFALGLYFSDEGAYARAAVSFEQFIEDEGSVCDPLHALFQTYMAWGLKTEDLSLVKKALHIISRLSELRSFSPLYLNEWGVALLRLKKLDDCIENSQGYIEEAIDKFKKAASLSEDEETLYNWGCALDLLGDITADEEDYAKAIDLLTKVFEKKPSELHIRHHLGLAFAHLGELTLNADCLMQAVELLDSVSKVDTEDEHVFCDLGYALLNLSEIIFNSIHPEESEQKRREAEKALIHSAELGNGDAYYHLACLYSLSGLCEASIHYLKKAYEADCLPSREDLESDEWLEEVRTSEAFQQFLKMQDEHG